jgi:hypothetical protein
MTGLNEKQLYEFKKECDDVYRQDTLFLLEHGWKKKNNDNSCNLWISPKGEEHRHHLGFFMREGERLAIDVAKHNIVLKSFKQFQVQLFEEDDEEPSNFIFPCLKDGKIYHYLEALWIAVYNIKNYKLIEWPYCDKDEILEILQKLQINHGDLVKIRILEDDKLQLIGVFNSQKEEK